jgi:hypothetical protein
MYPCNLIQVGAPVGRGGRLGHLVAEIQVGCSGGTRGTAVEYGVRRAGIHMRAVAGIMGNGFRNPGTSS